MKTLTNFLTLAGFLLILTSAGLSDSAEEITRVIKYLTSGMCLIILGQIVRYSSALADMNKRIRRNRQWRRIQTREQSYYTF